MMMIMMNFYSDVVPAVGRFMREIDYLNKYMENFSKTTSRLCKKKNHILRYTSSAQPKRSLKGAGGGQEGCSWV